MSNNSMRRLFLPAQERCNSCQTVISHLLSLCCIEPFVGMVLCPNHGALHGQVLQSSSLSSSSCSCSSSSCSSCAGTGVGSAHLGSRRGVQWGGVQQPEEHAHCTEQQLLQRLPQQQPGGAAQHAGEGAVAQAAQFWRRYRSDNQSKQSTTNPVYLVSPSFLSYRMLCVPFQMRPSTKWSFSKPSGLTQRSEWSVSDKMKQKLVSAYVSRDLPA